MIIDPQIDFLIAKGVAWDFVGKSVEADHTVENIEILFKLAKANNIPVFISPHYHYSWDHKWEFGGAGEMAFAANVAGSTFSRYQENQADVYSLEVTHGTVADPGQACALSFQN